MGNVLGKSPSTIKGWCCCTAYRRNVVLSILGEDCTGVFLLLVEIVVVEFFLVVGYIPPLPLIIISLPIRKPHLNIKIAYFNIN